MLLIHREAVPTIVSEQPGSKTQQTPERLLRALLGIFAAVLLASGGGDAIVRVFERHNTFEPNAGEHAEGGHEEKGEHVDGFLALKLGDVPAVGVELAGVERGGGVDVVSPGHVAVAVNAQSTSAKPLDEGVIPRRCWSCSVLPPAGRRKSRGRRAHHRYCGLGAGRW